MGSTTAQPETTADLVRAAGRWAAGWWAIVHLGALLLVLALSPSSYAQVNRRALARHLYLGTAPSLPSFVVLTTLLSLVVIRIVIVTALSYGLSQYALEMVVRVLVLELIPLTAALFAALRCTFPLAGQIAALSDRRAGARAAAADGHMLRRELLPRVAAGIFCALLLAAVSCVVTLVLAYLSVYGLTPAGFAVYTHTVGKVFGPDASLIFGLKIVLFGIAAALIPIATVLEAAPRRHGAWSVELKGLVRMFFVIVLIEAAALIGNYA